MKKICISLAVALGLCTACSTQREVELRIVHTTDTHGNLYPTDHILQRPTSGSMARLATLMREARRESKHLLLLDGGDVLQGEPVTYYSNYVDTLRSNAVTVAMNYLGYDALTIGNHDIEPGHGTYDRLVQEARFPVLGANVLDTQSGKPYFRPYKMFKRGGLRIAVLGLTTPAIPQWLPEHLWSGMRFVDIIESAKQWVPQIQREERPDVLIALIHSGLTNDNAEYLENAGERLAREVGGIDLILTGHDHRQTNQYIHRASGDSVLIMNAANHLDRVSDVRLGYRKQGGKWQRTRVEGKFVEVTPYAIDSAYTRLMKPYEEGTLAFLGQSVGRLPRPVNAREALVGASPYLEVVHRMQLATVKADISFAAPLSIGARLEAGELFARDLFKFCPFSNHLYAMELTGAEIKGYLEHSYAGWVSGMQSPEDALIAFRPGAKASDRYKTAVPTFNYSSAYGIDYTVDVTKPRGERVLIKGFSDGRPFELGKRYRVAINSYRAGGAGGMLTEGAGIKREDLKKRIVASSEYDQFFSLMNFLKAEGASLPVEFRPNWEFVPRAWVEPAAERDLDFIFRKK